MRVLPSAASAAKEVPSVFHYSSIDFRIETDENGMPWFCASDVCSVLGYANARDTVSKLCRKAGVAKRDIRSGGQVRAMVFIDEGNLYRLIIKSTKPEARPFEAWVCDEVLPAIRRTGSYGMARCVDAPLDVPALARTFAGFKEIALTAGFAGNQAVLSANTATRRTTGHDPLALIDATHLVAERQERHFTPTELASMAGVKNGRAFNLLLSRAGLQEKVGDGKKNYWRPTGAGEQYAVLLDTGKKRTTGAPVQQLRWYESVMRAAGMEVAI